MYLLICEAQFGNRRFGVYIGSNKRSFINAKLCFQLISVGNPLSLLLPPSARAITTEELRDVISDL